MEAAALYSVFSKWGILKTVGKKVKLLETGISAISVLVLTEVGDEFFEDKAERMRKLFQRRVKGALAGAGT